MIKNNLLDELDIFLIKTINDEEIINTRTLAKLYFFKGVEEKPNMWREVDAKTTLVNYRMKRMNQFGLVKTVKTRKNSKQISEFQLNALNVRVLMHKFPDKYSRAVVLRINNKWNAFEI